MPRSQGERVVTSGSLSRSALTTSGPWRSRAALRAAQQDGEGRRAAEVLAENRVGAVGGRPRDVERGRAQARIDAGADDGEHDEDEGRDRKNGTRMP